MSPFANRLTGVAIFLPLVSADHVPTTIPLASRAGNRGPD